MGEVYRARDPRIAREVAVKVLPAAFAENADRLRRFEQESRATGAVSHPNLLTVFDVGTHDGVPYIVSELLEGSTLRERMRSALPSRRAIDYATQIARGAGAAHDKGIVHRDLKPDNIFITTDERVKLLDFGLAKVLGPESEISASQATEHKQNTAEGAVMGTVAYMSPEQVRAQVIDHRTDIFSFGVVLYEMLSGARPFNAPSSVETMASIIHDDPPPLPATTPPALERIVMHAMEKVPANRFQSMKDVVFALDTFSGSGETSAIRTTSSAVKSSRRLTFRRGFIMTARFMPDGSIVYGATWEDQPQEIFFVVAGNPESRAAGFPNADILSVSSRGELAISLGRRYVAGYVTCGTLAQAPPFGGAPRELAEDVQDCDWTPDGRDLAVIRATAGGHAIELPLGHVVYEGRYWISDVHVSPRGDRLAFLEHELWGDDGGRVVIMDLQGRRVAESSHSSSLSGLAWTPSGDEVWTAFSDSTGSRNVWALSVTGKERGVLVAPGRMTVHDISRDGRLLLGVENARREVVVGTRGGARERNLSWLDWSFLGGMSGDGKRVLFEEQVGGHRDPRATGSVYVRATDGSAAVRLGEGTGRSFTPDGAYVGIHSPEQDALDIVPVRLGASRRVPLQGLESVWWDFALDGKHMVAWGHMADGVARHWLLGDGPPRAITPAQSKLYFAIAPDSTRIAAGDPEGQVMLFPFDGSAPTPVRGTQPTDRPLQWSADGAALFVCSPGRLEVPIDRIDLTSGARSRWLVVRPEDPAGITDIFPIAITRDGENYAYSYRRFLSDLYVVEGVS